MTLPFSIPHSARAFLIFCGLSLSTPLNAQSTGLKGMYDLFLSQGKHLWTVEATSSFGTIQLDAQTHWISRKHWGHHKSRFSYQGMLGTLEGFLHATWEGPQATLALSIKKGRLALEFVESPEITGDFTVTLPSFEVGSTLGTILQSPETITFKGTLHTGPLHLPYPGITLTPLHLQVTGEGENGIFRGLWHLTNPQKSITLRGNWKAAPVQAFFELQGKLDALTFGGQGLSLQELVTLDDRTHVNLEGRVELNGSVTWSAGTWTPQLKADLKDVGGAYGKMSFAGLNTHLDIQGVWPFITQGPQTLICSRLNIGTPLHHLKFKFEGTPEVLRLQEGRVGIDLGTIDITPFQTAWQDAEFKTRLSLQNVPFQPVIDLLEVEGLDVTGRVTGTLPLHIKGKQFGIQNARFVGVDEGALRYHPAGSEKHLESLDADDLKVPDNPLDLVDLALQDFRYSHFILTANKPLNGETVAEVALNGFNPILLKGYPFQFHVNISGPLEDVLQTALLSLGHASIGHMVGDETLQEHAEENPIK